MSTVRVFRSTDPGAPAHPSATRGSMAALLRACLVDGYGSGSINIDSLSVSGGVGTAAITTNSLDIGTRILIAGANEAELNAEWRITAADSSSVTLDMAGVADQTASGTITASIPGAGWEEPYAETNNYACFRSLKSGSKFYQIDDNVDTDVTLMTMFDSMSSAETGTGSNGTNYFGKYTSGKPTDWVIVADAVTCIVMLHGSQYGWAFQSFGEFYSFLPSDSSKEILAGHVNATAFNSMAGSALTRPSNLGATSITYAYILSSGLFSSLPCDCGILQPMSTTNSYSLMPEMVDPYDGTFEYIVHPVKFFAAGEKAARGRLRGVYLPEAHLPKTNNLVFTENGRDYIPIAINDGYTISFQMFIDITEWEESS